MLDCVADAVQRSNTRIARPREDQLAHAAHADELIVDQIWRHANEREFLSLLADDFMAGGIRDEMSKPFEGEGAAVADVCGDGVGEGEEFACHVVYWRKNAVSPFPCSTMSKR